MSFFNSKISLTTDSFAMRVYRFCEDRIDRPFYGRESQLDLCTYGRVCLAYVGNLALGALFCTLIVALFVTLGFIIVDEYHYEFAKHATTLGALFSTVGTVLFTAVGALAAVIVTFMLTLIVMLGGLWLVDRFQKKERPPGVIRLMFRWFYDQCHRICRPIEVVSATTRS